jgi:hypothetical protein
MLFAVMIMSQNDVDNDVAIKARENFASMKNSGLDLTRLARRANPLDPTVSE